MLTNKPTGHFLPKLCVQNALAVALIPAVFTLGLLMEQAYLSGGLFPGRGGKSLVTIILTPQTSTHLAFIRIISQSRLHGDS